MSNLEIRTFSESVRKFVHESSIPAEVKRLVLKDITREVSEQADAELLAEIHSGKEEPKDAESVHPTTI